MNLDDLFKQNPVHYLSDVTDLQ